MSISLFFYSLIIISLSAYVSADLTDTAYNEIKLWNNYVIFFSASLLSMLIGVLFGQSKFLCSGARTLEHSETLLKIILFALALTIESFLIILVSNPQFAAAAATNPRAQTAIIIMLVLNSAGLLGGSLWTLLEKTGKLPIHIRT